MQDKSARDGSGLHWPFIAAWACCVVFYFLQYAMRSAPGVMIPELTAAFALSAAATAAVAARVSANPNIKVENSTL